VEKRLKEMTIKEVSLEQDTDGTTAIEVLNIDGTGQEVEIGMATVEKGGLMSAEDKARLDQAIEANLEEMTEAEIEEIVK